MKLQITRLKDTHICLEIGNYSVSMYGYNTVHALYVALLDIIRMFIKENRHDSK